MSYPPTPGPWTVREPDQGSFFVRTGDRRGVGADLARLLRAPGGRPVGLANAYLMAAAPDMFKELCGIIAALEDGEIVTIEPGSVKAGRIRDAILKAEGEGRS